MPSNPVLVSGPAVGAAQTLICSYTCVFLPSMSTAIRTSVFSFVGALSVLLYIPHRDCLVDHVDLICSMYSWWEGFGSSSLATLPLGFNCGFISTSARGSWGLLLRLPWRTWVCPCEGQVWRWCSCLGCRGSGSPRYSGGLGSEVSRKYSALEGYGNQYWPIHSSIFAWRAPYLTEKPGTPQSTGLQRVGQDRSYSACIDARPVLPVAALPQ